MGEWYSGRDTGGQGSTRPLNSLAIHQRMGVAFNYRAFIVVPIYVPPINFPILFMINSQHSSQHSSWAHALAFFAPPLFMCRLCPCGSTFPSYFNWAGNTFLKVILILLTVLSLRVMAGECTQDFLSARLVVSYKLIAMKRASSLSAVCGFHH